MIKLEKYYCSTHENSFCYFLYKPSYSQIPVFQKSAFGKFNNLEQVLES